MKSVWVFLSVIVVVVGAYYITQMVLNHQAAEAPAVELKLPKIDIKN